MSALMFHLSIFDSQHNKSLIKYLISLDGEVVLTNCGIIGPERYFTYYDHFKVYLSIIGFDESDKLCWKHEIFLFR